MQLAQLGRNWGQVQIATFWAGAEEVPAFSLPDEFPGLRAKPIGDLLEGGELEIAVATFDEVEQHAADTELQGKIDLGQSRGLADGDEILAQVLSRVRIHGSSMTALTR